MVVPGHEFIYMELIMIGSVIVLFVYLCVCVWVWVCVCVK